MRTFLTLLVVGCAVFPGCSRSRQFELRGQVLTVDPGRQELTVKHEDIRGFMPGMTMPFKVDPPRILEDLQPGDLVKATLVVTGSSGYLTAIERTGHTTLADGPKPPPVLMLDPGALVPDLRFVDETGNPRSLSDWRGRIVAVTFIYTRCPLPDFCPRMDQHFKRVQTDVLNDARLSDRITLLSLTFDPSFDTPTVLAAHARQVGADPRVWHFGTGDRNVIDAFAARFGVSVIREGAGADSITHNLRTVVLASDGTLFKMFTGNDWKPQELMDALRRAH